MSSIIVKTVDDGRSFTSGWLVIVVDERLRALEGALCLVIAS